MKNRKLAACTAVLVFTLVMASTTAPAAAGLENMAWDFNLAPLYLWGANIEGDTTLGTTSQPEKVDFKDVFKSLEGAFTLSFRGVHDSNFGFLFDFMYLDINAEKDTDLGLGVDVGLKTLLSQLALSYRLIDDDHVFDVLGGVRYLALELDLDVDRPPISQSETKDLLDPVIGGRYQWQMADQWDFNLYGDIGGFGVGSEFTWQALGVINFWAWKHVGFAGGYRALGYQIEDDKNIDKFELDLLLHGPVLGVTIRW